MSSPMNSLVSIINLDLEGDILFLETLLYDNSSPRPPEALQANSNAITNLSLHLISPLRIMILLWRRLTCFLLITDQYHQ
ncbi:hypothetical protein Tco_0302535, partial [Tanacetum coccineum]